MKSIRISLIVFFLIILSNCSPVDMPSVSINEASLTVDNTQTPVQQLTDMPILTETPNPTLPAQKKTSVWVNELMKEQLVPYLKIESGVEIVERKNEADITIDFSITDEPDFVYYFVLSVPFTSLTKNLSLSALQTIWQSEESRDITLFVDPDDLIPLEYLLGSLMNPSIQFTDKQNPVCVVDVCYRISRFEDINPHWKVININGESLFDRDQYMHNYPLKLGFTIENQQSTGSNQNWPVNFSQPSNFLREKLTILTLTGTSALTRGTAFQMEENGILFPLADIKPVFEKSDLLHISHEVPMFADCPPAVPLREEMRFCSSPDYIYLFETLEVDIMELTGNHLLDWGVDPFLETLDLLDSFHYKFYGAGRTIAEAEKPLFVEHNGNRFVFFGCNYGGPENVWVREDRPGVLKCDLEKLLPEITAYAELGYLPIMTFQHFEVEDFSPITQIKTDFQAAAEAGAVIVSGSQAHFPQGFDFVGDSFLDYGLGNLFFDQMATWNRKATIDEHYFYDGRYLFTELVSIINEDMGKPRLMTEEEERRFMEKMFEYSFYVGQ